jgi:hypothetical protein
MAALRNFAMNAGNHGSMIQTGVVPLCMQAMRLNPDHALLQSECCGFLAIMAVTGEADA